MAGNIEVIGVWSSEFVDNETEDKDNIKLSPVSRSLFAPNDGKGYLPSEPSLFAPIDNSVDDRSKDDVDYCYNGNNNNVDAEVEEDYGNINPESEKETWG